jgi:membrane protease YdiL (CAAX protease family)
MLKRFQIPLFFLLTFALTWVMWIPAVIARWNGEGFALSPDTALGQIGRWAPGIIALLIAYLLSGKDGMAQLIQPIKNWKVGIGWFLVALFLQPALFFAAKWMDSLIGNTYEITSPLAQVSGPIAFVIPVVIVMALPGSFAEELGWRGFALPKLQKKYNALTASAMIALLWGIWHIPSMLYIGENSWATIVNNIFDFIPVTIVYTWLYNNTKGSLLPVTLFHASQQYSNNFLGTIPTSTDGALMWLVAFVVLALTHAANLSRKNERIQSE